MQTTCDNVSPLLLPPPTQKKVYRMNLSQARMWVDLKVASSIIEIHIKKKNDSTKWKKVWSSVSINVLIFPIKIQWIVENMAGVGDYFSIGSTVACKTCYEKEIEGEVLAFDQQTKMLILSILLNLWEIFQLIPQNLVFWGSEQKILTSLKICIRKRFFLTFCLTECQPSTGKTGLNDVHIVNLSLVSDVQVKKEISPVASEPTQSLNLQRLNTRLRNQIDQKKRMVKALQGGNPEGQQLFITISKTIDEVAWNGPNIVVFNKITITPPYKSENVQGREGDKAFLHVKKMVSILCFLY